MTTEQTADVAANTNPSPDASTPAAPASHDLLTATGEQQATETGAETPPAGDEKPDSTDGEKPAGAPEKYEFAAPEGQQLDDAVLGAYSEAAKELNLSQDAAQKVLSKVAPVILARQLERQAEMVKGWETASVTDKEFGGEKLNENIAIAEKALATFGSPELRSMLKESGLGKHPEVIRMLFKAGKAISEDGFVGSDVGATLADGKNINATLYNAKK